MVKIAEYDVTVGADPEVFIIDTSKKAFVSGHNLIPGTKKAPRDLLARYFRGCACQADGTALEVNIAPASSAVYFASSLGEALAMTQHTYLKDPNLCLTATPVARYTKEYFNALPHSALELGCDPDFDAWKNGEPNPRPTSLPNPYARTGAGHVAVGWRDKSNLAKDVFESSHFNDCIMMAQMMDLIHEEIRGMYERQPDDDYRRGLYGKRGAFRAKPFGVEYRTPSNSWLNSNYMAYNMFGMGAWAFAMLASGKDPTDPATVKHIKSQLTSNDKYGYLTEDQFTCSFYTIPKGNRSVIGDYIYQYGRIDNGHIGTRSVYDFQIPPKVASL